MQAMQATPRAQTSRKRLPLWLHVLIMVVVGELLWLSLVGGAGATYVSWQRGLRASHIVSTPLHLVYSATDMGIAVPDYSSDLIVPDAKVMINNYGQLAGSINDKPFLWTPTTPHGSTGTLLDFSAVLSAQLGGIGEKGPIKSIMLRAFNDYGQIAGTASLSLNFNASQGFAFLWTPDAANGTHGRLSLLSSQGNAWVASLSSWGQVLLNFDGSSGVGDGALWTPTTAHGTVGTLTSILPVGSDDSDELLGINGYGQVIAQSYKGSDYSHAYLWTPTQPHGMHGTVTVLRSDGGEVTAINDYGQVLGATINGQDYLWTPVLPHATRGVQISLNPLSGDSELDFHGLSASGATIGTSFVSCRFLCLWGDTAVIWQPNKPNGTTGALQAIGDVSGDGDSYGDAINSENEALGSSCSIQHDVAPPFCTTPQHLVLWDSTHGLHNLQDLLDSQAGANFALEWFDDSINDAGEIVAFGRDSTGHDHLLLLAPHAA